MRVGRRKTNEGLLPLDCLIDAGTAILSTPDQARRGGVPQQQAKRPLAVPPKTVGMALGASSSAGRPKLPPATTRLPSAPANKGAGDSARKRASKQKYYDSGGESLGVGFCLVVCWLSVVTKLWKIQSK